MLNSKMEVITEDREKDSSKCPQPCKECKPICKEFKKLYVKDSELIEHLCNDDEMKTLIEKRIVNKKGKGSESKDEDGNRHVPPEIKKISTTDQKKQSKLKCSHCDKILEQVNGLLDEIKIIKQTEAQGLCKHCKLTCFSSKCKRCYYLINKYLSDKMTHHKIRQQEYKIWLSKVKQVLLSILQAETVCRHKERIVDTASNQELESLLKELKKPLCNRDLEIGRFPISEFKDTFDISDSLTESKDILDMVLKKLKAESEKLKRDKEEGAFQTSSSHSMSSGSIPSLKTKFERLQAKYAMIQKPVDSDFAFASDMLEKEFKSKIAKGLKQTPTTHKVLQFGSATDQKSTDRELPSKYTKLESIIKKGKDNKSFEPEKGEHKKETSAGEKEKANERDISNDDLLTERDLEAAKTARRMKMIKQDKDKLMKEKEMESKQRDKSIKIPEKRGTTASIINVGDKETENESYSRMEKQSAASTEKYLNIISSESEKGIIEKELEIGRETKIGKVPVTGKETGIGHEIDTDKGGGAITSDDTLDKKKLKKGPLLSIQEKLRKKEKSDKNVSTKGKTTKKNEGADDDIKGKGKKERKGKKEQYDEADDEKENEENKEKNNRRESHEELDSEYKTKKGKGTKSEVDSDDIKEQRKKLKPSESAKLLLKLLKEKEKERAKKAKESMTEGKIKMEYDKKIEKLKKKMEKTTNRMTDINKLGKTSHKHRRQLGHVRSDFLTQSAIEDANEINTECDDAYEITEMIKGDQVVPFDHNYKKQTPDPEKTLFFKVKQDLAALLPLEAPSQFNSTITVSENKSKKDVDKYLRRFSEVNIDINAKGIFRYALSKQEYIDKGYTKLPSIKVMRRMNIYRMVPTSPKHNWFVRHKLDQLLFYDTDEKLAEIDEDCHGRWYYKNGILALDYYKAEEEYADHRYVIYSSGEKDAYGNVRFITVLASFDQLGNGVVYDHNGNLRVKYNQSEGIIVDEKIAPPGRWKWHSLNDPPVLQPIYLDTYLNFKERGLTYHQHHQELLHTKDTEETPHILNDEQNKAAEEMLSVEFDMFVKKRADKLKLNYKPFQIRMKAFKINEQFSLHIVDQRKIYLIFREGLVSMKLNIGMKLISSEIVDTEVSDVSEVLTPFDRSIPKSSSVANIKHILDNTKMNYKLFNR